MAAGQVDRARRDLLPEAALGPTPHLYPFIVNDPGEGAQAKRRAAAVVVDHLTPPLARAGAHGPGAALERLIDEYHEAASQDPRRCRTIARAIVDAAEESGFARDCGLAAGAPLDDSLARLDGFLCELKDLQIRDGLHVFGRAPGGAEREALLLAIARAPRGPAAADASLTRALAADLGLEIDPLASTPGPNARAAVDRVEALALDLVAGRAARDRPGPAQARCSTGSARAWRPRSTRAAAPSSTGCSPGSTDGASRPGRRARRPAAGPTRCPPGATSSRSTCARCRRRRPGRSAGRRRARCSSATCKTTATTCASPR
jgi:cobaltochelatase CobN